MRKVLKWLFIIFMVIFLVIVYARYIGTMGFDTLEYTIYSKEIPTGFDGIKIVHFSDLHYNRAITFEKVNKIIEEINLINPDIVVFTGDLIDKDASLSDSDFTKLSNILKKIDSKYGKYAVVGNHDYDHIDKVIKVFSDSKFKYLDNEYDIIYNDLNEKIFIGGVNTVSHNLDDVDKTLNVLVDNDEIDYRIVLVHEPDISDEIVKDYSVNLILAGHSHNGQVRLPIIGAVYTPPYSKKYYDNYYNIDGVNLYISSGIGVSTVNYRLWNRPSINFYRINKETSD